LPAFRRRVSTASGWKSPDVVNACCTSPLIPSETEFDRTFSREDLSLSCCASPLVTDFAMFVDMDRSDHNTIKAMLCVGLDMNIDLR
jgi:hypothetical protein